MKLIFTEYLASLQERGELDVIIPDILSEIGLSVLSKPAIGTKQYGVDVAAVGELGGGVKRMYLLSIKPGVLRRTGWNNGAQSLRPSLDQIRDVYIQKLIPKRHKNLPVVIVLCLGGYVHEDIKVDVDGYMDNNTEGNITYEVWNGDSLAEFLLTGILRENALPENCRSNLRKSIALVDEPEAGFGHFCGFVSSIADNCRQNRPARLTAIRQIYLGLWTMYVWAREGGNIEAVYLSSERAVLEAWPLVKDFLFGKSKEAKQLGQSMKSLIALHQSIVNDYIASYIEPRAQTLHGLSSAIQSDASLDINLKLFDLVGRVSASGLWTLHLVENLGSQETSEVMESVRTRVQSLAQLVADMVSNNPILYTPIKDSQAIDINIACLFLERVGCYHFIQNWIQQIAHATVFAYRTHGLYPCIHDEYRKLIDHPLKDDSYRIEATAGSLLIPTLAVWAAITEDKKTLGLLAEFTSGDYVHATLQLCNSGILDPIPKNTFIVAVPTTDCARAQSRWSVRQWICCPQ